MLIKLASPLLLQDLVTPNMHTITQRAACSSSPSENPSFTSIVSLSFFSKVLYGQQIRQNNTNYAGLIKMNLNRTLLLFKILKTKLLLFYAGSSAFNKFQLKDTKTILSKSGNSI